MSGGGIGRTYSPPPTQVGVGPDIANCGLLDFSNSGAVRHVELFSGASPRSLTTHAIRRAEAAPGNIPKSGLPVYVSLGPAHGAVGSCTEVLRLRCGSDCAPSIEGMQTIGRTIRVSGTYLIRTCHIANVANDTLNQACIIPAPYVKSGQETLSDVCDNLNYRMTFIFGTPNIVQQLQELEVSAVALSLHILEVEPETSIPEVFSGIQSIMSPFIHRISLGTNVETLSLSALQIDSAVLEVIGALPCLRTLHLSQCNMDVGLSPLAVPSVRSFVVQQIDAYDIMDVEYTSTELVKYFPCLLSYTHIGSLMAYDSVSLADIRGSDLAFFSILECLHLINIPAEELSSVIDFLRASRELVGDEVCLVHFFLKISPLPYFDESTSMRETCSLFAAMHLMPIRFLHLEGLNYVRPDLIDAIATSLPLLEHLTLIRQTKSLDEHERRTKWSRTMLDYVPHLASFHCLQHFAFDYPFEHLVCYPSIMSSFEDGFAQEATDCLVEESWDCIFRVFVAYIPSLQTLNFLETIIFRLSADRSVESMRYNSLDELRGDIKFAQAVDPQCRDPRSVRRFQGK